MDLSSLQPYVDLARRYFEFERDQQRIIVSSPFVDRHLVSCGIAVQARSTKEWLVVHHGTTPNWASILRSFYRFADVPNMVMHLADEERQVLARAIDDSRVFREQYELFVGPSHNDSAFVGAFVFSYARFVSGLEVFRSALTLPTKGETVGWTWPKGRRSSEEEPPLDAAWREFREETGIEDMTIDLASAHPCTSSYRSNNGRIYETQIWVGQVDVPTPCPDIRERGEIVRREWKTSTELRTIWQNNPTLLSQFEQIESSTRPKLMT